MGGFQIPTSVPRFVTTEPDGGKTVTIVYYIIYI